ncbi:MAG: VanZ family protein [Candidatus Aminicenantes bacterium]|nr:VanZ family protein [Candidatus Aminicenantes bacterium]
MQIKKEAATSWIWVVLCALAIFFTVPLAGSIRDYVASHIGRSFFGIAVLMAAGGTFLGILYVLYVRLKIRTIANYVWLTFVSSAYVFFTIKLWESPEEAVHFIEYGLLGFFLFRAFRHHIEDNSLYPAAFFFGALVGIFDEIFQWIIPGRYWDIRDVGLNALSSGLIQILIWKGLDPKLPSLRWRPKSIRIISSLLAANLLVFGLCFSNRPRRVEKIAEIFPALSALKNQEAMSEFRYRYKDPDIGIFFSRLTLEELKEIDSNKAEQYGSFLEHWKNKDYAAYLKVVPGSINPFLHEIRVHIFRRDKRFTRAAFSEDASVIEENYFIAYKENLILEEYFGKTLANSPYKWNKDRSEEIQALIDETAFYKSPVSAGAFAAFKEWMMWAFITGVLAALLVLNRIVKKRTSTH